MITFKNPYLGNTCVPFQHWVCSLKCAHALEVPARLEQIAKAKELDAKYENYVSECNRSFKAGHRTGGVFSSCVRASERYDEISYCETMAPDSVSLRTESTESSIDFTQTPPRSNRCLIM